MAEAKRRADIKKEKAVRQERSQAVVEIEAERVEHKSGSSVAADKTKTPPGLPHVHVSLSVGAILAAGGEGGRPRSTRAAGRLMSLKASELPKHQTGTMCAPVCS